MFCLSQTVVNTTTRQNMQGGRGHWTVNYTFILFVGLKTLGTFIEFILLAENY